MIYTNENELYVTIETGGSIGEIYNNGYYRIYGSKAFADKSKCIAQTRRASSMYGGGYYDYHYTTKTLAWARKNCDKFEDKTIVVEE